MGKGLEKMNVPIPLLGSLDTKSDEYSVKPGDFLTLENAVRKKLGNIKKRFGFDPLSTDILPSGSLSSASKLAVFKNELILMDGDQLYSYYENEDAWVAKGYISNCFAETEELFSETVSPTIGGVILGSDTEIIGNIQVTVWVEYDGTATYKSYLTATDLNTGATIDYKRRISPTTNTRYSPKVVNINGSFYLFIQEGTYHIDYFTYDPSTLTLGSVVTLVSTIDAVAGFDVIGFAGGVAVAYPPSATSVSIAIYNTSLVSVGSVTVNDTPKTGTYIALSKNSDETIFAASYVLSDDASVRFFAVDETGSSEIGVQTVCDVSSSYGASSVFDGSSKCVSAFKSDAIVFFHDWTLTDATGATRFAVAKNEWSISGAAFAGTSLIGKGVYINSKPFLKDSKVYCFIGVDGSPIRLTPGVSRVFSYLVNDDDFTSTISGRIVARFIKSAPGSYVNISKCPSYGNTFYSSFTTITRIAVLTSTLPTKAGVSTRKVIFDDNELYQSKQIGGNLLIAGGVVKAYDGRSVVELGFFHEASFYAYAEGAGSIAAGTRFYMCLYEWTDNFGQIHRSAPSLQLTVTLTSAHSVVLSANCYFPTDKHSANDRTDIRIRFYRTVNGGNIFYFIGETDNDFTANIVTFTDDVTDANLITGEQIYTTGGEVENVAPPACRSLIVGGNRVFVTGLEDKGLFWFSKKFIINEGVQFADVFTRRADQRSQLLSDERIVGGEEMDGKLIILKEASIIYQTGDGPLNTGLDDTFTSPDLLSTDGGATEPFATILTPVGIMYKGSKGIYVLRRNLSAEYIGAQVEDFNDEYITSAVLLSDQNEVRFTTLEGSLLCYNYYFNQWSVFTNYDSVGGVVWKGVYCHLKDTGVVNKEATDYIDSAASIPLKIGTGWIKLSGIQNYQRIYKVLLLGRWKSDHTIRLDVYYDYQDFIQDTYTLTPFDSSTYPVSTKPTNTNLYAQVNDGTYQFEVKLNKQKCQAVRFLITDQPVAPYGESFELVDMTIQVGIKKGTMKVQKNKRGISA